MAVKGKGLCLNCMIKIREWQRKKKGSKARHTGTLTYRLESQRKKIFPRPNLKGVTSPPIV